MKLGDQLRRLGEATTDTPGRARSVALERHDTLCELGGPGVRGRALALLAEGGLRGAEVISADRRMASGEALFLDTETTGLGVGPGTCAFLVGLAWIEPNALQGAPALRVEQRLMTRFAGEAELLRWVRDVLGRRPWTLVSYNGRAYDLPLLEARAVMQRLPKGLPERPHLDVLHPARALWSGLLPDCRLATLERGLLDHTRPIDLPGAEIPAAWLDFVREGGRGRIDAILAHNREDLVSLAAISALVCAAFRGQRIGGKVVQGELGRALLKRRRLDAARRAFERSLELGSDQPAVLDGLATALRRLGRVEEEEALLRRWIRDAAAFDPHPHERLAILLEHRKRALDEARAVTRRALEALELRHALHGAESEVVERFRVRLARLERRAARS